MPKSFSMFSGFFDVSDTLDTSDLIDSADITLSVAHEIGTEPCDRTIERVSVIPASNRSTIVKVRSSVITGPTNKLTSPAYLATIRRRKSRALADAMRSLEQEAAREDFVVCTYSIVKSLNEFLEALVDGVQEGNSREILRQLRNTFLDGNWNAYREPQARKTAIDILMLLATREEVTPEHANDSFASLLNCGTNPVGMPLFSYGDEESDNIVDHEVPG